MASRQFAVARALFAGYLAAHPGGLEAHPGNLDATLGVAEADLGLRRYETAELEFRRVVAVQPELWLAHKNLVIVEAALGRWEEFDRERALLKGARERGAPGISARESDVIDAFDMRGRHWIVRAYYQPVGRSQTIYNFESFSPDGRVSEYISLEPSAAAQAALAIGGDVRIGSDAAIASGEASSFALNWYNGHAHGAIRTYGKEEPSYEQVRADVLHWLRTYKGADAGPKIRDGGTQR